MEIMIPNKDFDFNSARSTPYTSAPSTPKPFGDYYYSAPPSPDHLSKFYRDFDDFYVDDTKSCSDIPIGWEEEIKPVSSNFKREKTIFDDDFAFDVSGELGRMTLPAEELFDGGKIRPLKPAIKDEQIKGDDRSRDTKSSKNSASNTDKRPKEQERGRERNISSSPSRSRGRSVSPFRVSKYPWEEEEEEIQRNRNRKQSNLAPKPELTSASSSLSSKSGSKKWRLKDFFLFRSASEGRTSDKDPLKKYTALFKKNDEKKISSSRMSEGGSVSKRRGPVSAHELHYTKNRAVSEDMKKKTFLPYKQGILGRLFV